MTDRERVARAMVAASRPTADPDALTPAPRGQVGYVPIWQTFGHLADAALAAMPTWRRIPGEVREGEAPFDGRVWDLLAASKPPSRYIDMRWHSRNRRFECVDNNMHWIEADEITHYAPIPPIPAPPAGEVG